MWGSLLLLRYATLNRLTDGKRGWDIHKMLNNNRFLPFPGKKILKIQSNVELLWFNCLSVQVFVLFWISFPNQFFLLFFPHKFQLTCPGQFVFRKMVSPGGSHTCRLDKCAQKGLFFVVVVVNFSRQESKERRRKILRERILMYC